MNLRNFISYNVGNKMKTKLIVLFLLLGTILLSGCTGNNQPSPEENVSPGGAITPEENVSPEEITTQEQNLTSAETRSEVDVTPVQNETEVSETPSSGVNEAPYLIRLDNYRASASSLEIKKGETVAWINIQENPTKRVFTLVSEQDLFENTNLVYRRPFAYTFNETGQYDFSVIGQPKMNVTVNVVEP